MLQKIYMSIVHFQYEKMNDYKKLANEKSLFYQTVVFVESMKERSSG